MADQIRQALERLLAAIKPKYTDPDEIVAVVRAMAAAHTALAAEPPAPDPREALAARPLLEAVARLGDCIGQHTVGEIKTISDRAAAWLRENPPGQPVAIEPRGCPTPGACSCVEPPAPAEPVATLHVSDFRGYENYDFQHLVDLPPGHYKLFTACTAQPPAPAEPDTDAVLTVAAIIREVDGNNSLGAAALAEAILAHPNAASVFQPPAPAPATDPLQGFAADLIASQRSMDPDVAAALTPEARWDLYAGEPAPAADGERDHVPGAGNMVPAAYAARLRQCPTHGQLPANAWGCPECLRELREELARLRPPAADGEVEELAQWLDNKGRGAWPFQVEFGALAPPIDEQLRDQDLRLDMEEAALWALQCDADGVTRLFVRGILTEAEAHKAKNRILQIIKKHVRPLRPTHPTPTEPPND